MILKLMLQPWMTVVRMTKVGGGYRNYPDYLGSPARDEVIWRASVEGSRFILESIEVRTFARFDDFASDNADFDTSRLIAGLLTSYRR